ncbi:MAG: FkbM family methyltransferase [Bryobacteraceae bacterium]
MQSVAAMARQFLRAAVGQSMYGRLKQAYGRRGPDGYLGRVSGVIHVGANAGQEQENYARHGLDVVWIEALPEAFAELQANLAGYPKQRAFQRLVTDEEGREYRFHVADNEGQASSIYELAGHRRMWPEVQYRGELRLRSTTLSALLREEGIEAGRYQALVLDTQGSELLVLRGAVEALANFRYIKAEAADFEMYEGGCRADEVTEFLARHGFAERRRDVVRRMAGVGTCYEILYRRTEARSRVFA